MMWVGVVFQFPLLYSISLHDHLQTYSSIPKVMAIWVIFLSFLRLALFQQLLALSVVVMPKKELIEIMMETF